MKIVVNGKACEGGWKTAFEVRDSLGNQEDIVILNGFQINEDHALSRSDLLSVIPKGMLPPEDELESMMAARHTPQVFERVKKGRVAVSGLGGLGSHIAVMLARTGVGHLLLVDYDVVEPSNLNRQSYYIRHLGMPKTQALLEQIREINPFISVETKNVFVTETNASGLFSGYGIVCEAFDDPVSKSMLVNTLLASNKCRVVAASGMAGYESANLICTTRSMKRLYLCGDGEHEAKVGSGLMAPRVQVCAGHQANMVLRLLLGLEEA